MIDGSVRVGCGGSAKERPTEGRLPVQVAGLPAALYDFSDFRHQASARSGLTSDASLLSLAPVAMPNQQSHILGAA